MKAKYDELGPSHELIKKADFWGEEGQERLSDSCIDDCIEYIVDMIEDLDVTIEAVAFSMMKVQVNLDSILADIVENLDEEYGDPDGDAHTPTQSMIDAANQLARVIEKDYAPWACEAIGTVEVDVFSWVKEHRPDWLEESR
jgi:hypothetical protein